MRLSNHCKADFDKEQLETDYGDDGGSEQGAFLFLTTLSDYETVQTVHTPPWDHRPSLLPPHIDPLNIYYMKKIIRTVDIDLR